MALKQELGTMETNVYIENVIYVPNKCGGNESFTAAGHCLTVLPERRMDEPHSRYSINMPLVD